MKAALRSRLERLEVVVEPKKPQRFRSGVLKTLPKDYVGEHHVVIVKREPTGAPGNECCEFEERPGPAPVGAQERGPTAQLLWQSVMNAPPRKASSQVRNAQ